MALRRGKPGACRFGQTLRGLALSLRVQRTEVNCRATASVAVQITLASEALALQSALDRGNLFAGPNRSYCARASSCQSERRSSDRFPDGRLTASPTVARMEFQ